MRQFYLINGKGNRYSLMDIEHWLYEPEKLGARFSSKYEQIDANFIRTNRITKPDDIEGKILFTGHEKYQSYFDFMKFIAVEPLALEYYSNGTYKANVDLKSIDKSEISDGVLECKIKFKRLSRWYKHFMRVNDGSVANGKVYDYSYDYTYTEDEPETITVDSDSGYPSPTKIVINGPCENPVWRHYLNNEVVAEGSVTANIRAGRKLEIDCTKIPYTIHELDPDGTVVNDLYQSSDFTQKRFFMLEYGKNRVVIDHDGTNTLKFTMEARLEYETV